MSWSNRRRRSRCAQRRGATAPPALGHFFGTDKGHERAERASISRRRLLALRAIRDEGPQPPRDLCDQAAVDQDADERLRLGAR